MTVEHGLGALLREHGLAVASLMLIASGVTLYFAGRGPSLPTITCRATNPGMRLGPEDGDVRVHPAGREDELVADGRLFTPIAVPQGRYDIRISLSRSHDHQSRWLRDVPVDIGASPSCELAFTSGELSVDVVAGGSDSEDRAVVYVYEENQSDDVVASMGASEPVLIDEGRYDVRIVLTEDAEEKDTRWIRGLVVEAGLRTRTRVHFQRGTLALAATNAGETLPAGAVTYNVYRAGDRQLEIVDSGTAGAPLALPVGRYDIAATFAASHDAPERWLHDIVIEDDLTSENRIEFSSGAVSVDARVEGGEPIDAFSAYVHYYVAGEHQEAVAYTPLRAHALLSAGTYDVRVDFVRSHDRPDLWLRDVVVEPGEIANRTVFFSSGQLLVRAYGRDARELIGDNVFLDIFAEGEHARPVARARAGTIAVLSEGRYDVRARDTRVPGRELWLRSLNVRSGELLEKHVDFAGAPSP